VDRCPHPHRPGGPTMMPVLLRVRLFGKDAATDVFRHCEMPQAPEAGLSIVGAAACELQVLTVVYDLAAGRYIATCRTQSKGWLGLAEMIADFPGWQREPGVEVRSTEGGNSPATTPEEG
jgi:hypothetical protein